MIFMNGGSLPEEPTPWWVIAIMLAGGAAVLGLLIYSVSVGGIACP